MLTILFLLKNSFPLLCLLSLLKPNSESIPASPYNLTSIFYLGVWHVPSHPPEVFVGTFLIACLCTALAVCLSLDTVEAQPSLEGELLCGAVGLTPYKEGGTH